MIYILYFLSILLVTTPLIYIFFTRQLQMYYVYCIAAMSFLVLNLLGTISPNITLRYENIGYNFIFLLTASLFHVLFWVLYFLPKTNTNQSIAARLLPSLREYGSQLKKYIASCVIFSLICMVLFSLFVSPPFFLRMKEFNQSHHFLTNKSKPVVSKADGQKEKKPNASVTAAKLAYTNTSVQDMNKVSTQDIQMHEKIKNNKTLNMMSMRVGASSDNELLIERMHLVAKVRAFHWFALVAFELPLFLVVLMAVTYRLAKASNLHKECEQWRNILISVGLFAVISSLWILSKQYLMYICAAYYLVMIVFKNKIEFKKLFFLIIMAILILGMLYVLYQKRIPSELFLPLMMTLLHRVIEVYPWAAAVVYNIFPTQLPYLHGASMINLLHLFHFQQFSVANLAYYHIYGMSGGSAPLPAIFESYANWGWTGVVVTQLIIMLTILAVSIFSWSKDLWIFSLSCYLTIKLIMFWQAPLWYAMYEPTLIVFLIAMYLVYLGMQRYRLNKGVFSSQAPVNESC